MRADHRHAIHGISDPIGFVASVVAAVVRLYPTSAEFEELVGAGLLGLASCAVRYDPTRGISFSTFAHPRVCGAVLDARRRESRAGTLLRLDDEPEAAVRVEDLVIDKELHDIMVEEISRMPMQRGTLMNGLLEDMPVGKARETAGLARSTAREYVARSLKNFRATICEKKLSQFEQVA